MGRMLTNELPTSATEVREFWDSAAPTYDSLAGHGLFAEVERGPGAGCSSAFSVTSRELSSTSAPVPDSSHCAWPKARPRRHRGRRLRCDARAGRDQRGTRRSRRELRVVQLRARGGRGPKVRRDRLPPPVVDAPAARAHAAAVARGPARRRSHRRDRRNLVPDASGSSPRARPNRPRAASIVPPTTQSRAWPLHHAVDRAVPARRDAIVRAVAQLLRTRRPAARAFRVPRRHRCGRAIGHAVRRPARRTGGVGSWSRGVPSVGRGGTPLRSPEQDRPVARWEDP